MIVGLIIFTLIIIFVSYRIYKTYKDSKAQEEYYKKRLEDENLYDPETGEVITFDDLSDEERVGPNHYVKEKDTREKTEDKEDFIPTLQLTESRRQWLDHAFLFLVNEFGKENIIKRDVYLPDEEDGLMTDINSQEDLDRLLLKIATLIEIDPSKVTIGVYDNAAARESDGMLKEDNRTFAAGLYYGADENGNFDIGIEGANLKDSEFVIATIAHELSHVKLLGENRILENDEHLTDMLPLIYGLGIFNANTTFKFDKSHEGWRSSTLGYLSQMDWGYLFALYAYIRDEGDPEWCRQLNPSVAKDFEHAVEFIRENPNLILKDVYKEENK